MTADAPLPAQDGDEPAAPHAGIGSSSWFRGRHQEGLDSALNLLLVRKQLLDQFDDRGTSQRADLEVIGVGLKNIQEALRKEGKRGVHDDVLSAHPSVIIGEASYDFDRNFVLGGGRMRSIYNFERYASTGPSDVAMSYLTDDLLSLNNFVAPVPVQVLIFNRSTVILEGPEIGDERSAIAVSDRRVVQVALDYWRRQHELALPVQQVLDADPLARFTPRQRQVAALLADDLTDVAIAAKLDLSLRTVQGEAASIMRLLGVRSRFGAGLRLGKLGFEHLGADDAE